MHSFKSKQSSCGDSLLKPAGHSHLNPPGVFIHLAPLEHGLLTHSSSSGVLVVGFMIRINLLVNKLELVGQFCD